MKLLRLLADEETSPGAFEWQLNEPIKAHPHSQIALQQASLSILGSNYEVTNTNNTIILKTAAAVQHTATITVGDYTAISLLHAVERAMNATLDINVVSDVGFQWRCELLTERANIMYDRNDPGIYPTVIANGGTWVEPLLTKTAPGPGYDCWLTSTKPFIRSAGKFSTTYEAGSFPCMGLSITNVQTDGDPANLQYAIYVSTATNTYHYIIAGAAAVDTTTAPAVNDELGVEISLGNIRVYANNIYYGAASPYDYEVTYYPVISLAGVPGGTTNMEEHYTDPFSTTTNDTPNVGRKPTTTISLVFDANATTRACAQLLGYLPVRYDIASKAASNFLAPFKLSSGIQTLSLLVLLESMPYLSSYDSSYGGRRPILASINAIQDKTNDPERYDYMPSTPIFLDMDNEHELFLSNFRIRVIDAENNPIQLSDGVSFTILIK